MSLLRLRLSASKQAAKEHAATLRAVLSANDAYPDIAIRAAVNEEIPLPHWSADKAKSPPSSVLVAATAMCVSPSRAPSAVARAIWDRLDDVARQAGQLEASRPDLPPGPNGDASARALGAAMRAREAARGHARTFLRRLVKQLAWEPCADFPGRDGPETDARKRKASLEEPDKQPAAARAAFPLVEFCAALLVAVPTIPPESVVVASDRGQCARTWSS